LGVAAGVDFPYLLFADQCGMQVAPARGKSGLGWMRLLPDVPLVLYDLLDGYLKLGAYWHSLKATRVESVFSRKDPMPSIAEFVLLPYFIKKKYGKHSAFRVRSIRSVFAQTKALGEEESRASAVLQ
jgi:predicted ATP-grasp superfamily ATP-dependent carboligase